MPSKAMREIKTSIDYLILNGADGGGDEIAFFPYRKKLILVFFSLVEKVKVIKIEICARDGRK